MDVKVVRLQGVLPVSGFFMLTRVPLVLAITGSGFKDATAVRANGVTMDEFSIISDRLILVGMPTHMGQPVTSVRVSTADIPNLSVSPTHSMIPENARVAMGLGTRIEGTSGILRLTQTFVKVLFTTPGTSLQSPNIGGGARSLLGKATSGDSKALTRSLAVSVGRTAEQITSMQAGRTVPPEERLLSAILLGAAFDPESAGLSAVVMLSSFNREQAVANIVL